MNNFNRKIAIIGANEFQCRLIERSKELKLETHVFSWSKDKLGKKIADNFYTMDVTSIEEILSECRDLNINGVCSVASDLTNVTVNYIRNSLSMTSNSDETLIRTTDKYEMRMALKKGGCSIPRFYLVDSEGYSFGDSHPFPCIVKPVDRSGSRGIYLVEDKNKLSEAIKNSIGESFSNKCLIEEFVEGREFSIEAFSYHGKHYIIQFTEKFTTGFPNFIERGHLAPARLTSCQESYIENEVIKTLNALGVEYGCSHTELKMDANGEVKIIESASRMGGDFIGSDLVSKSTNLNFLDLEIALALGDEVDTIAISKVDNKLKNIMVYFLFDECDLEKFNKSVRQNVSVIDESINENKNSMVKSSAERNGYIIFSVDNKFINETVETLGL